MYQGESWSSAGIMWTTVAVGGAVLLLLYIWRRLRPGPSYPPGPPGNFLTGNALQMDPAAPHKTLSTWAKEYGDVYSINMFGQRVVVVSGYESIREVLLTKTDIFYGRPGVFRGVYFTNFYGGLVFGKVDHRWARLKKLCVTSMKMYGDGLGKLEQITLDIVQDLLSDLKKRNGQAVNLGPPFSNCMANIISSVIYCKKLETARLETLMRVKAESAEMLTPTGPGSELDMFPWLRFIPTKFYKKMAKVKSDIWDWFEQERMERKAKRGRRVECVMDTLLAAQEHDEEEGATGPLRDGDITAASVDLIMAGTSTSSVSLSTLFALMVNIPDLQKTLSDEVDHVVGRRQPRLADRDNMPYMKATILEVLRYITPAPIPAPHAALKDSSVAGQPVPKGTTVMLNLWNLHHDERYWTDPWEFKPGRFLGDDGRLVAPDHPNRQRMLAFSAGRRGCIGETMATNRIFLILASLIQNFTFTVDATSGAPGADPRHFTSGLVLSPNDFTVCAIPK